MIFFIYSTNYLIIFLLTARTSHFLELGVVSCGGLSGVTESQVLNHPSYNSLQIFTIRVLYALYYSHNIILELCLIGTLFLRDIIKTMSSNVFGPFCLAPNYISHHRTEGCDPLLSLKALWHFFPAKGEFFLCKCFAPLGSLNSSQPRAN